MRHGTRVKGTRVNRRQKLTSEVRLQVQASRLAGIKFFSLISIYLLESLIGAHPKS